MNALRTLAWVAAIVYATVPSYWLIVHPRARRWAQGGGRRLSTVGPLWMLLWLLAGALTWRWRRMSLYDLPWTWAPGGALILTGLLIYVFARQNFSTDQVLGRSELEPERHEQALRTGGIRAYIRHPYYLGHLCELLGWALGTGLLVVYGLAVFGIVTGYFMIRAEERELAQRFPGYAAYRTRTAAILPGIW